MSILQTDFSNLTVVHTNLVAGMALNSLQLIGITLSMYLLWKRLKPGHQPFSEFVRTCGGGTDPREWLQIPVNLYDLVLLEIAFAVIDTAIFV